MKTDFVILSVPHCEPLPMVAPVLLAGCLESAGISARGIDLSIDFMREFRDQSWYAEYKNFLIMGALIQPQFDNKVFKQVLSWTKNYLLNIKEKYNPRYIGISIFSGESLDFGLLLSYQIRKYLPEVILTSGGKGLETNSPDGRKHYEIWIENQIIDCVIVGDAETAIIDMVKNDLRGVVFAKPQTKQDLDNIPMAKWDDYDLSLYPSMSDQIDILKVHTDAQFGFAEPYLAITGSKGCVRQCTFCDVADFWPDYIYRDPIKVAEEIIHNYKKTGISKFRFMDNLMNGSITNFRTMNQVLADQIPNQIRYGGFAIFRTKQDSPEKDFELASLAGCTQWNIGIESGSERLRSEMRKKFDNSDLDHGATMLYKYSILQKWLMMVGYPSETDKDFQESIRLLERYKNLSSGIIVQITSTFVLLDNSPLISNPKLADQHGLAHNKNLGGTQNKFWTSTRYLDNDFLVRSARWKKLAQTAEECGYIFLTGNSSPIKTQLDEIENLEKLYNEQKRKIFPLHTIK